MPEEQWLTVEQVAERLQMHPDTIRRLLREKKIHGHLINRRAGWRIRENSVERFITGEEAQAADSGERQD